MCNITKESPATGLNTDAVQLTVADAAVLVAGADSQRRSVTIINDPDGTAPVYVCGQLGQRSNTGIKLKPGVALTLETVAPVFVSAPTVAATVYVLTLTGAQL